LLKNGALNFISQQKNSFSSGIFNVMHLVDKNHTKYAPALIHIGEHGRTGGGEFFINFRHGRDPSWR